MAKEYTSESIEVLSGLEPVRKRPGMYTDTSNPNHLIAEVVDMRHLLDMQNKYQFFFQRMDLLQLKMMAGACQ